ncbi:hypothetical protein BMS3Abin01_00795 [bacterium BMS3Abin01]|nr:hypothetical protein BMS3Abin01_00795 [bacterium BMS3Abin01]
MDENMKTTRDAVTRPRLSSGRILFLLILLAMIVRVVAVLSRQMIMLDETAYVRLAQDLVSGNGMKDITEVGRTATHFSPLLPLLIAGLSTIVRDYVVAAYVIVIAFGSLILLPTYLLGKEFVSERVGLMAAAIVAVLPLVVDYSSRIYNESVYVFFLTLAFVFGFHMIRGCRVLCSTLAGASLGLAYLANPAAIYYPVLFLALLAARSIYFGLWRQMIKAMLIFLLCFAVYAVPYFVFLHAELGEWTYSGKTTGGNYYTATHDLSYGTLAWEKKLQGLTDDGQDIVALRLDKYNDPLKNIVREPVLATKVFARQGYILVTEELPKILPLWLLPLLGLGLFASGWDRRRAAGVGYFLLLMLPALFIIAFYVHDRFFLPFLPLIAIWVAQGWQRLEQWGDETLLLSFGEERHSSWRSRVPWLVGIAVLAPLLLFSLSTVLRKSYPTEYRVAGEWIKETAGPGERILSRYYSPAFYADGIEVILPYADYQSTTDYAREKDVDYLVIGKRELADWRPELFELLSSADEHPQWVLVKTLYKGTDRELMIFRLNQTDPG